MPPRIREIAMAMRPRTKPASPNSGGKQLNANAPQQTERIPHISPVLASGCCTTPGDAARWETGGGPRLFWEATEDALRRVLPSRNSLQCLHLIAAARISSPQYGQALSEENCGGESSAPTKPAGSLGAFGSAEDTVPSAPFASLCDGEAPIPCGTDVEGTCGATISTPHFVHLPLRPAELFGTARWVAHFGHVNRMGICCPPCRGCIH